MEYLYESVIHQKDLPIKIFTHTLEQYPYHWHEDVELLFILSGACEMKVGHETINLAEDDLFIINKNEIHFTRSIAQDEKTQILLLQFDLAYFKRFNDGIESLSFKIDKGSSDDITNKIKHLLAKMMYSILEQESSLQLKIEILMLELIMILITNFSSATDETHKSLSNDMRQLEILKYIDAHYMEADLSLNQIADAFYMNPQYLSRYFKNKVGISLKKFLDNMRLNKSLVALQLTDERILDIALKYGFPDAKAYYRVFKEVICSTPQEYRDKHKIGRDVLEPMNYFNTNSKDTLSKLTQFLELELLLPKTLSTSTDAHLINVDLPLHKFMNTATKLTTFGYAPHGLRSDFEAQLKQLQAEIGFEYIRFHGIFSEEMRVCSRHPNGQLSFNFNHVDTLIDILIKNNIKPFIEIGFMPKALSSSNRTMFSWEANVSPPKNIDEWLTLVSLFIKHLINRYGIKNVETWYFEFWNEPEIPGVFWESTPEHFFDFFRVTYNCIKSISPKLRVGGFGNIFFESNNQWLGLYNEYAKTHQLKLDFFSFHLYNIDLNNTNSLSSIFDDLATKFENLDFDKIIQKNEITLGSPQHLSKTVDSILALTESVLLEENNPRDIWITEWNTSTVAQELIRDTCFSAAFIIKTLLENMNKVSGMGFWTFTDIFEEMGLPQSLFHGGFGLMTYNGLRKPSFHAFAFIKQLGTHLIAKGDNCVVTRSEDELQILAYNYCHFNDLYRSMDFSQVTPISRYHAFKDQTIKSLDLTFESLSGKYQIERQWVNRDSGSVFDAWIKIGAPNPLTNEAFNFLTSASQPAYSYEIQEVVNSVMINMKLQPHEIQLIKIKPIAVDTAHI